MSPTLDVAQRIVEAAGYRLRVDPEPQFEMKVTSRGRPFFVPQWLRRLPVSLALAKIQLPHDVFWSEPGRVFDLADRRERMYAYQILLQEGRPEQMALLIDGALLVDMWDEVFFPVEIRAAWQPLIGRLMDSGL